MIRTSIAVVLLVFVLSTNAKSFTSCELTFELKSHDLSNEEVAIYTCLASKRGGFNTAHGGPSSGYYGIFNIGSQWWCGQYSAGQRCNVQCSDLMDEDLTDDIQCARRIFSDNGLSAWGLKSDDCATIKEEVKTCLNLQALFQVLFRKSQIK